MRPSDVRKILPWSVTDLSLRPFPGMWSFNPSIHFDGTTWRCSLRCADYAMPNGVTVRGGLASSAYVRNRNVMVELDPRTWRPTATIEMVEADNHPRITGCTYLGYADLRLFQTARHGLQAIAASMQLAKISAAGAPTRKKAHRRTGGSHPAEQTILTLDSEYRIIEARPIRGGWSGRPQKNWSPFDRADVPRFLYSIDRGLMFSDDGPLTPSGAMVSSFDGGFARAAARTGASGTGGYHELRGGTQLVYIGDQLRALVGDVAGGAWLSLAHDMRYVQGRKFYWHLFYAVDSTGRMLAQSEPFKLAENGIEFAAGLAWGDGERVMISFGVDDMECRLGETSLAAILELLAPVDPEVRASDSVRGSLR